MFTNQEVPAQIKIGPFIYQVFMHPDCVNKIANEDDESYCMGSCYNSENLTIHLLEQNHTSMAWELWTCIFQIMAEMFAVKVKNRDLSNLALGMTMVLRDNPGMPEISASESRPLEIVDNQVYIGTIPGIKTPGQNEARIVGYTPPVQPTGFETEFFSEDQKDAATDAMSPTMRRMMGRDEDGV